MSNLVDVYCELDYLQHKRCLANTEKQYIDKAERILRLEIDRLRLCGLNLKPLRCLLLL